MAEKTITVSAAEYADLKKVRARALRAEAQEAKIQARVEARNARANMLEKLFQARGKQISKTAFLKLRPFDLIEVKYLDSPTEVIVVAGHPDLYEVKCLDLSNTDSPICWVEIDQVIGLHGKLELPKPNDQWVLPAELSE